MMNYANQKVKNKNMTEIIKSTVYGPDNYMLRKNDEVELMNYIHQLLKQRVDTSSLQLTFDSLE